MKKRTYAYTGSHPGGKLETDDLNTVKKWLKLLPTKVRNRATVSVNVAIFEPSAVTTS